MGVPEKIQMGEGGLWTYVLEKNPGNFRFVTLHLEIWDKAKNAHGNYTKLCYIHSLETPIPNTNTHGNST